MLDHRVAHGRAKQTIAELSVDAWLDGTGIKALLSTTNGAGGSVLPLTDKGARKKIEQIKDTIKQSALVMTEGQSKKLGPFISWIGIDTGLMPGFSEKVVGILYFRVHPRRDAFALTYEKIATPLAIFSMHSIARNHQRGHSKDKHEIASEMRVALPSLYLMVLLLNACNIHHVFAPTESGIFLGERFLYGSRHIPFFKTFIQLETASDRWRACYDLFCDAYPNAFQDPLKYGALILQAAQSSEEIELPQIIQTAFSSGRFDWLTKP